MNEMAPGLPYSHTVSEGESIQEALHKGRSQLQQLRNYALPRLPVPGPLTIRAPRTGNPAVAWEEVKEEWIDSSTKRKRDFREGVSLKRKFLSVEDFEKYSFPLNMDPDEEDAFPFVSDNRYVAIIHADGNGLGEHFFRLAAGLENEPNVNRTAIFQYFSNNIKEATEAAAQMALSREMEKASFLAAEPTLPFRPLVLGGDDLTVIIRAEYALSFTRNFIECFERETAQRLTQMNCVHVPQGLTACAGVCFVKANHPFYLGYQLAESLCGYAKDVARRHRKVDEVPIPSAVTFHRVTTSFVKNYDEIRKEEMSMNQNGDRYSLTMGAYGVGGHSQGLPPLKEIIGMKSLFQKPEMSGGPMRHYLTLLHADPHDAKQAYARWVENMEKDTNLRENLVTYNEHKKKLIGDSPKTPIEDLLFQALEDGHTHRTFIGDLMQLIAVEGEAHDR